MNVSHNIMIILWQDKWMYFSQTNGSGVGVGTTCSMATSNNQPLIVSSDYHNLQYDQQFHHLHCQGFKSNFQIKFGLYGQIVVTEFSSDLLKTSSTSANGKRRRRQQAHRDQEGEQRHSGLVPNFSDVKFFWCQIFLVSKFSGVKGFWCQRFLVPKAFWCQILLRPNVSDAKGIWCQICLMSNVSGVKFVCCQHFLVSNLSYVKFSGANICWCQRCNL